jgi:hypothetical protein
VNCCYCDKIKLSDPACVGASAVYDLGSAAPRCARHWRYHCGLCGTPAHFMAVSFCPEAEEFFCSNCASEQSEVESAFWAWKYCFRYRSPWPGFWVAALDRLELEQERRPLGRRPLKPETRVRFPYGPLVIKYLEPPNMAEEQFLAMLRFEGRSRLEELQAQLTQR